METMVYGKNVAEKILSEVGHTERKKREVTQKVFECKGKLDAQEILIYIRKQVWEYA